MVRLGWMVIAGCLAALAAGRPAWAEDPPQVDGPPAAEVPDARAAYPEAPAPIPDARAAYPGKDVAFPPFPTTEPYEGGKLLGDALYGKLSPDQVARAVPPVAWRQPTPAWQGSASLRYRFRGTTEDGNANDQDLYGYLKLRYRDETLPGWSASFHGRATVDIDQFGDVDGFYAFDSITDTYAKAINGRIYHLYANYRKPCCIVEQLRLGRYYVDVGEYLLVDGGMAWSRPFGKGFWQIAAWGGVPAYLFESSSDGDWTAGGQITGKPWRGADVKLDFAHITDRNVYGTPSNNLWNFTVNQRFGLNTLTRLTYQHLNEEPRLMRLVVDSLIPRYDLTVRGFFHTLFTQQGERVYDFDYYYWVTLDLEPYWMANLSLSKGIGEFFSVEAGGSGRQLYDSADEGRYNREYGQYFLTLASYDWIADNLNMSLSAEWWNSDEDIWTVTFDADYRPSANWRFGLGTDYAAYRYDLVTDTELVNTYGGFLRAVWSPTATWRLQLRIRVDKDDYGTWTTLDAGATVSF